MKSNPQILSGLQRIRDFDHYLELINIYQGVPFIYKANVIGIHDDQVEIETYDPALVCLAKEKQTNVLGNDYFEPAVAHTESVDLLNGKAVLTDFTYQSTRLGERMVMRVEPKEAIPVIIEDEDQSITAELVDLSMNGMGVHVEGSDYSTSLKPGTTVQTSLLLPKEEVRLAGNILTAIKTGSAYRLSVRFLPNNPHRVVVFRYLIDRRAEIAVELQKEYEQALQEAADAA